MALTFIACAPCREPRLWLPGDLLWQPPHLHIWLGDDEKRRPARIPKRGEGIWRHAAAQALCCVACFHPDQPILGVPITAISGVRLRHQRNIAPRMRVAIENRVVWQTSPMVPARTKVVWKKLALG